MIRLTMLFIFVMVLLIMCSTAGSSDDRGTATADATADATAAATASSLSDSTSAASAVGGDQTSRALALSQSLGDVDIEGCVVTEQWGIIVYQRQNWDYDPWCLAAILDQQGLHKEAAQMRCSDKDTEKLYGKETCIKTLTFLPTSYSPAIVATPNQPVATQQEDCCNEDEDEDEVDKHHQQIEALTNRLDKYESDRQSSANAYRRQQQQQQQQYEEVQEFQEQRQRKIDQIKKEFGDDASN